MPIEKGQEWGHAGELPVGAPVAQSDADVATLIDEGNEIIGVANGDLARTLGIGSSHDSTSAQHLVSIDALRVTLDDDSDHLCVAHAMLGNLRLHAHVIAVMNAAFVGPANLAPRAHPGDGTADVVTLQLGFADRFKAWRRMATASHLPHPGITVKRMRSGAFDVGRRRPVYLDGRLRGRSTTLGFEVVPNAIMVAV